MSGQTFCWLILAVLFGAVAIQLLADALRGGAR